ncbi:MFS transporter [Novosphingobium humi]|uniref:MFS transporter n=1 Tax=Novosphingobium humi TaxID=2282397 RepID=A0ABY7U2L6_9SPHN|nr:MFS transporter [Novosphingobium humi]WCT79743.1 MFS transporter [Novosphingobium humi]
MLRKSPMSAAEALYVLAYLGANIAFMPILVLLLPRRVASIGVAAGGEHLLGLLVLAGGITASLANIVAGRISDRAMTRRGNRRSAIAGGLACLSASYGVLAFSYSPPVLALGVIGFQVAVNLLLGPIGPLIADYIPDERKGNIAGFLNCGVPVANGSVAVIAWAAPSDGSTGFGVTMALVAACVLPLLVLWPFGAPLKSQIAAMPTADRRGRTPFLLRNLALAWWARFLLQLGAALLTNYLYPYIAFLMRGPMAPSRLTADSAVGWLSLWAALAACCGAVAFGRLSDMLADRRSLMIGSALLAALALTGFAAAPGWWMLAVAYALFHLAQAAFFSVEAAFVAEIITSSPKKGRWLGYMNLANTLPAILITLLAMQASERGLLAGAMHLVLLVCASACILAAGLCFAMRDQLGFAPRGLCAEGGAG